MPSTRDGPARCMQLRPCVMWAGTCLAGKMESISGLQLWIGHLDFGLDLRPGIVTGHNAYQSLWKGQLDLQPCLFLYTEFVFSIFPPRDRDGGISSSWFLSCPSPNSNAHLHSHAKSECHLNCQPPNAFALPTGTRPLLVPLEAGGIFCSLPKLLHLAVLYSNHLQTTTILISFSPSLEHSYMIFVST